MAAPATVEDALKLIRRSGLIDEQRLDAYLQQLEAARLMPTEPRKLAGLMIRDGLLTYFQAEQFLLGKWRGFTIGKYRLLERIGFGGMGQVFLCEHQYMRRRVAIKVLPPAKAEEPAALGRFYREARAAGILDHPNIVRTHDIDQDGPLHFLVMEYVDGTSFLDLIKKFGPMDVLRATHYICQSAQGLAHAFRVGIIHRDIKPGNILVDRDGQAKILDMGLARFYHDQNDLLTLKYDEKSVLGTADYVAPEQTINSHEVDIRADIYGLGATYYFLLAGHPPFPEGSVSQKLLWHQTRMPTPIRTLRPEVPEGIQEVLERMLAKDPRQRYQTPAEVAEALAPWTQASIPPPPEAEMPKLSPAAMEQPMAGITTRDPGSSWSGIRMPEGSRSGSRSSINLPEVAPLTPPPPAPAAPPPAPPMFATAQVPSADPTGEGTSSLITLRAPAPAPIPVTSAAAAAAAGLRVVDPLKGQVSPSENTPITRPSSIPMFTLPPLSPVPSGPNHTRRTVLILVGLGLFVGLTLGVFVWMKWFGSEKASLPTSSKPRAMQPAAPRVPVAFGFPGRVGTAG